MMRGPVLVAALLLPALALACGAEGRPLPRMFGAEAGLGGLSFGSRLVDVRAARPSMELATELYYVEELSDTERVGYGFLPFVEGRPPDNWSTLEGLELREEFSDTSELVATWSAAVEQARSIVDAAPRCSTVETLRFRAVRVQLGDSLRVTLTRELHLSEDARDYDAYLSSRIESPVMVRATADPWRAREEAVGGLWRSAPCRAVLGSRPASARGRTGVAPP